jgi:PBP1b-binding outer membrane lipoprotein LpoB
MKKVFLAFAFIAALLVTSCKKAETAETTVEAKDSTAVQVDSTCVDSVNVDTTKAAELEK